MVVPRITCPSVSINNFLGLKMKDKNWFIIITYWGFNDEFEDFLAALNLRKSRPWYNTMGINAQKNRFWDNLDIFYKACAPLKW